MKKILLLLLLLSSLLAGHAQGTCTVCPGTVSVNTQAKVIQFLYYDCVDPKVCLTTGTYTGYADWSTLLSEGSTGFVQGVSVVRDASGLVTITFPPLTPLENFIVDGSYASLQFVRESSPWAGVGLEFQFVNGQLVGTPNGCSCIFPLIIESTNMSLVPGSSCNQRFTAQISNANNLQTAYLQRSMDQVSWTNVGKQDIYSFVNDYAAHTLIFDDLYPKRNQNGNAYYRLRVDDINGRTIYSKVHLRAISASCNVTPNGPSDCTSSYLVGTDSLCSTSVGIIKLVNPPLNSSVVWSVTPADQSIVSLYQSDVDKVYLYKRGAGNAVITAYLPGCNKTLTKNIQVTSIPLAKLTNTSTNQSSTLSLNTSVTAGNYRIDLNCPTCTNVTWTGSRPLSPTNGNQTNFSLVSGSAWVRATGNNACGPFTRTYNFYVRSGYGFTVTPNPSGGLTTLAADAGTSIKEVRVFDQIGREYFKKVYPNGVDRAQIDLSSLKGGFYLIQINNGKESKVQQLVIKK